MAETAAKKTAAKKTAASSEPTGLDNTGNPLDVSTRPESNVSSDIAHQDGAPEELTKLADENAEQGYFGQTSEKADYSQANPEVMNGGGKG